MKGRCHGDRLNHVRKNEYLEPQQQHAAEFNFEVYEVLFQVSFPKPVKVVPRSHNETDYGHCHSKQADAYSDYFKEFQDLFDQQRHLNLALHLGLLGSGVMRLK